jgi:hypothetical protein
MRNRRVVQFALLPIVLALCAFSLVACGDDKGSGPGVASGGGSPAPSASAGGNAPIGGQDAQLKFAQCMRENGVNMPDPKPGEPARITDPNVDQARLEAATKTCQPLLQAGGGAIDPNDPAVRDAYLKFAQCMRDHGVNMPDPGPNGQMQIPTGVSREKLQAAQQQCSQYMPGGGGR